MKFIRMSALFVSLFGLATLLNAARFGYGPNDAFWRTLLTAFEGTVWAPGFSEAAFLKVRTGMVASEVASLVGDPLRKDCGEHRCIWIYTWQDTQTADFDQRWVIFGATKRVEEIRKSFYID